MGNRQALITLISILPLSALVVATDLCTRVAYAQSATVKDSKGKPAEKKGPTTLTDKEAKEAAELLIDMHEAQARISQLDEAYRQQKEQLQQAATAARQAYWAKVAELQKVHGAGEKVLDKRQKWVDPQR